MFSYNKFIINKFNEFDTYLDMGVIWNSSNPTSTTS